MGVSMFVLNCLQIWGERELVCVCVLMWIPWVASIIVFSSQLFFIMERQKEDVGGFRLQHLKEGLNKCQ